MQRSFDKIILLFCLTANLTGFSQRSIVLKRSLTIKCPNPEYAINICNYSLLVPANRPGKQEVTEYKYSIPPDHVTKTENDQYYIHWKKLNFSQLATTDLEVTMKIKLKVYDFKTAKKQPVKDDKDLDTLSCLKDEENFRSKSKPIREVAAKITGTNREEITKNIFNYVVEKLDYKIFFFQDRGAKQALKEGKGDCTEYSELMITLCRAKNIPARIVAGLIPSSAGNIGYHNWVEVYFPQYGWVAFDPTWADNSKSSTTFYTMKNAYIRLSNERYFTHISTSCRSGEIPFSIRMKDTCIDLSNGITKKRKDVINYYNNSELDKANNLLDTLLIYEPDNYDFWLYKGAVYSRQGDFQKAKEYLETAYKNCETQDQRAYVIYAFANYYALKGDVENAIKSVKESIDLGFNNYDHFYKDVDFEKIKDDSAFIDLKNELKAKQEAIKKEK